MSHDIISFEKLNAYVDGELDPIEAAEVARAVADDIELADQVSALCRLRAAVTEGFEAPFLKMSAPANARWWQPAMRRSGHDRRSTLDQKAKSPRHNT